MFVKVINEDFNVIETPANVEQIINYIKDSLGKLNLDNSILNELLLNMDNINIQIIDGETYSIKLPNDSLRQNKILNEVGALKTNMVINSNDKELNIIPGVVMRKNFNNHQLIHEILHGISSRQHNLYNEDGITYTKTGTKIDYYDNSLNDYPNVTNLSSEGLNEGITEYLASLLTNEYNGNYASQVVISSLFMKSNNNLLNAYFMNDISGIEKFYDDIEEKQTLITREDFIRLTSKSYDFDLISKIIAAGIKYNKAYGKEMTEKELSSLTQYLDNNMILDSGSWKDLIANYQTNKTL